jgi:hypothetical protein
MKTGIFGALARSLLLMSNLALSYPMFECLGDQTDKFYEARIIDVGDQDGEITVSHYYAPKIFRANYRETRGHQHRWVFGYELYNQGISPVLSELNITYNSGKTAVGRVSYFEHDESYDLHELIEETISCKVTSK